MKLKLNDTGINVQDLQTALNQTGCTLTVDGWFGAGTLKAVKEYQAAHNLVVDGIVGDRTWAMLHNIQTPQTSKALTESDLIAAASRLGCELPAIKAIIRVEAPKGGFDANGNPTVLFERHKMYQAVANKYGKARAQELAQQFPNLVNPNRGGYIGGTTEWSRLNNAITIDRECALASASYGRFQVMGFNHAACGYDSVEAFFAAMQESEGQQLNAFVGFIEANPNLKKSLKSKNWASFAEGYNGAAYKANAYDTKLAHEYAKAA